MDSFDKVFIVFMSLLTLCLIGLIATLCYLLVKNFG